jgi:hypothetical protein
VILLLQPPQCWDYKPAPPPPTMKNFQWLILKYYKPESTLLSPTPVVLGFEFKALLESYLQQYIAFVLTKGNH